jgi:hypothetical protein
MRHTRSTCVPFSGFGSGKKGGRGRGTNAVSIMCTSTVSPLVRAVLFPSAALSPMDRIE